LPKTVYGVYPGRGVFKSVNGGVRWSAIDEGLSLTTIPSLAVDSHDPQVVYAGGGRQGLFTSSDGGIHWRSIGRRLTSIDAVALDPLDSTIVLAAGARHSMIRSVDGGRTWLPAGAGLTAKSTVLAIRGERAYSGTTSHGVFTSSDGGSSWHGLPGSGKYVQALAIAPDNPAVIYAGYIPPNRRGLYKSTDGGRSWRHLTHGLSDTDISAVVVDPEHPATIYIGNGGDGVFKTTDGGATWQRASAGLPGIRVKAITANGTITWLEATAWVAAFAIDPANPRRSTRPRPGAGSSEARTREGAGTRSTPASPFSTSGHSPSTRRAAGSTPAPRRAASRRCVSAAR
jgi:hypothetical protein